MFYKFYAPVEIPGFLLFFCLAFLVLTGCEPETSPQPVSIDRPAGAVSFEFDLDRTSPRFGRVEIRGLAPDVLNAIESFADWTPFFRVDAFAAWASDSSLPAMMGRYEVDSAGVRFWPRFPLAAGEAYRVYFDERSLRTHLSLDPTAHPFVLDTVFTAPALAETEPAEVVLVYPTADSLPANLLKLYIQFSRPMAVGEAYERLSLVDEATEEAVAAPFVEIVPELWDPHQMRFTLLFDPGRIKRLVGPNLELGPPLREGRRYRLLVDRGWNDTDGRPLARSFEKRFFVTEADRVQPDVAQWIIAVPSVDSVDALAITFPEPLDAALLQRLITVHSETSGRLEGRMAIANGERRWTFMPDSPWAAGRYRIEVAAILEDLAGNTLQSLFDVDLEDAPASEIREVESVVSVPFEVRK